MGFSGMFIGAIFVIVVIVIYAIALVELIIGIVLLARKKKVPGTILLILSAIPAVVTVIIGVVLVIQHEFPQYENYDGRNVIVKMADVRTMMKCIRTEDTAGLDELLDKHPELIYYQNNNHETLLEYGLHDHNVEIMEIAYDHGARFDAEPTFKLMKKHNSLERFFNFDYWSFALAKAPEDPKIVYGEVTDDMIEAARFAIDHGANTVWTADAGPSTFADSVESWIKGDNVISEKDQEFLDYARTVNKW